ncbi:glycosyltransferase family 9 protein [Selenomonadales bacterium OttesenSCG-928-I06]|nr:glycosyltransferase family 9 protein [Selenomonadales bacterium OttesenSCG-928-I06]
MNYKNILIVKLSAIGDIVNAIPVAAALRELYPNARITWIAEKTGGALLKDNPNLDELIIFEKKKFTSLKGLRENLWSFIKFIRSKKYDLVLDIQGLFKSTVITSLTGAKERLVFDTAREGSNIFSKRVVGPNATGHVVERYLDVVRHLGGKIDKPNFSVFLTLEEAKAAKQILKDHDLIDKRYVVMALGAGWPNKVWPQEYFAELSNLIYDMGYIPVAIGGAAEEPLYKKVADANKGVLTVNLVNKTPLKQLAYIIKNASAFIGGDTGATHIAVAVNTPIIALLGPTIFHRNCPYGDNNQVIIVDRPCVSCKKRGCPKGLDCLSEISVEQVLEAFKSIMKKKAEQENNILL